MGVSRRGQGGPWLANVLFNKHSYCKSNPWRNWRCDRRANAPPGSSDVGPFL